MKPKIFGALLILVLFWMGSAHGESNRIKKYRHLDIVHAVKDAHPDAKYSVKGYSCEGLKVADNYFGSPEETYAECERIMAQWPTRKAELEANKKDVESQQKQEEEALLRRLGLSDEDLTVLKRALNRKEGGQ